MTASRALAELLTRLRELAVWQLSDEDIAALRAEVDAIVERRGGQ